MERTRTILLLAAAIVASMAGPATLFAQAPGDLQRDNERLRTENADLEQELAAARERIARLEQEIEQLREALRQGGIATPAPATTPPPPQVTIDETVPDASPRALQNAIASAREEAMAGVERGQDGSPTRRAYLQRLTKWAASANVRFRSSIEWTVRVNESQAVGREGLILSLTAVDPVTKAELGDPFDVVVSRAVAERMDRESRNRGVDLFVLRGTLMPGVAVDPARESAGPFGPTYVGPFTLFSFSVEVRSIVPIRPEDPDTSKG